MGPSNTIFWSRPNVPTVNVPLEEGKDTQVEVSGLSYF
jgi:hypothetical protein